MKQPTDFEKHAKLQFSRIQHLMGCPESQAAIRDYLVALCAMGSPEAITKLMDEIVSFDWDRFPTAHQIATIGYNMRQATAKRKADCPRCDGVGVVTEWRLVTYHGQGFAIEKSERIDGSYEQAMDFARKLANASVRQTILSCAAKCGCAA